MRGARLVNSVAVAALLSGCLLSGAPDDVLRLGSTTSTRDAGLLDVLTAAYEADTGHRVLATVAGSGEVLEKARRGDLDVVLTHDPEQEVAFVARGDGTARLLVMTNRFLVVGPPDDPREVRDAVDAVAAFGRLANGGPFVSRGDASGTHAKELALWRASGAEPRRFDASWYKETGAGQSQTLLVAQESRAYALTDEATWLRLRASGRLDSLEVLVADDAQLVNQYAVVLVNATRHPHIDAAGATTFAGWLTGPRGQAVIDEFRIGDARAFSPMERGAP